MRKFRNIISILIPEEKKKFFHLLLLDIIFNLLDIAFLVGLLFVVGFYTGNYPGDTVMFIPIDFFERNPFVLITCFFVLFSLKNLFGFYVNRMQFRFVYKVASRISENNLENYLGGGYEDWVSVDSSVHIRKISQQPVEFSHYVLRGVQLIISNVVLLILTIIPILIFNSTMFLLLFLVLLPPVLLTIIFARKKLSAIRSSTTLNREKAMQHLHESLSGFIEINIYQQKNYFLQRYKAFQEKFNASLAEMQVVQSMPSKLMEVFAVFGLFVLVTATSLAENKTALQVLLVGGFMAAAYKIIPGVVKILNSWEQVKTYSFTIDDLLTSRVNSQIAETSGVPSIDNIEFRDVSFSYKDVKAIENFSTKITNGDFVGISGTSGAGKTTIINILLGFLSPASGSVLINEEVTTATGRQNLWDEISYGRQQPFFIHESLKENILFGQPYEEDKFNSVLTVTGVDTIAKNYPAGMNMLLAENGKNMSGGERQRMILARALYKNAGLLILDEPLNELDEPSVNSILLHLQKVAASGKIVLMITHDRHNLSYCNKIICLDES